MWFLSACTCTHENAMTQGRARHGAVNTDRKSFFLDTIAARG